MSGNKATRQCQDWFKGPRRQGAIWAGDKRKSLSSPSSRWASADGIIAACSFEPPHRSALCCNTLMSSVALSHPSDLEPPGSGASSLTFPSHGSHSGLIEWTLHCDQIDRKQITYLQLQRQCAYKELPWLQTVKITVKWHVLMFLKLKRMDTVQGGFFSKFKIMGYQSHLSWI